MIDDFCRTIIERARITTFVETGSFQGETIAQVGRWFSELYPEEFGEIEKLVEDGERGNNSWNGRIAYPVWKAPTTPPLSTACGVKLYSIDISAEWCRRNRIRFATNPNVIIVEGSSELVLADMLAGQRFFISSPWLFFLDAHWNSYWPLRDELKEILKLRKFIVVFDDLRVPGQPKWGYDVHEGKACAWETVKDLFEGRGARLYYPHRSNRDNRGWGVVFVGYTTEEIDRVLAGLPMEEGTE